MDCYERGIKRWFPYFAGFNEFTPTIPKLYWDVESQEQRILELCRQLHKLICYIDFVGDKVNINHNEIQQLKTQFQKFIESGFDDYYREMLEKWVDEHMADIISRYVHQVFFGLTLDGYFVAYIPEGSAWNDVIFDTGQVYDLDTYGRLILYYETDSSRDVWQDKYAVNDDEIDSLSAKLALVEQRVTGNESDIEGLETRVTATENELNNPLNESEVDDDN